MNEAETRAEYIDPADRQCFCPLPLLLPAIGFDKKRLTDGCTVGALRIPLLSLSEQAKVVRALEQLSDESRRLEFIYRQKLAALDSLKKSLLHEAFSGNLQASDA